MRATEKHIETARRIVGVGWGRELQGVAETLRTDIAYALAQAERDGMKRAAEQCKRYRDETASLDDCLPKSAANNASMIIQNWIISEAGEE